MDILIAANNSPYDNRRRSKPPTDYYDKIDTLATDNHIL